MSPKNSDRSQGPGFWELARQALSSTSRGYDLLAPKFEHTDYATPEGYIMGALNFSEFFYPLPRGPSRGADLACGTGRATRLLARHCTNVDAFDFSKGMLAEAARLSSAENIRWMHQDLATIRLEPRSYHRIVTFGAWGHVLPSFREAMLREVFQALAPGGIFLTITADEPGIFSRRYWFNLTFDFLIRLRNRCWPGEFHMYYGLNNTMELSRCCNTLIPENCRREPIETVISPVQKPLTLFVIRRRPNC